MGIICIMFGIIVFAVFTGLGVVVGNLLVTFKDFLATSLVALADTSNLALSIGAIAVFGFIGLMIGLNYVMQGLTYNKVCKIERRRRRRND